MKQARNERLPPEHKRGIKNLQVASGPHHIRENWWNTDVRKFKGIDEQLDATKPWRWKSQLDNIYAEHFLEHLDIEGAIRFLTYSGNALTPQGRIRLSTPSLEWVMSTHFRLSSTDDDVNIMDTLKTNRAFHGWGHQFLYSKAMLSKIFKSLNFSEIRYFGYGESDVEVLKNMELHGNYSIANGFPSVWVLEAMRGNNTIAPDQNLLDQIEFDFSRHVRSGH